MSEVVDPGLVVNITGSNVTEAVNSTVAAAQFVASPEGMALAYVSLVLMALVPIFFGALRSVDRSKSRNSPDMPETITSRDAARFPIVASCFLFGLYLLFKFFPQDYMELLMSLSSIFYFALGVFALSHTVSPLVAKVFPSCLPNRQYELLFTSQGGAPGEAKEELVSCGLDVKDLVCLVPSGAFGLWYLLKKHWVANNVFGLALALNGVDMLHLSSVGAGCVLLGGLFVYDIFWVFGTDVMETVARSIDAPIKLVFPQDLLERGLEAGNFAMLGLGDVVIPGVFIALLLRFDVSLKKNGRTYFYSSFLAYILGLALTIVVMHTFRRSQPALLYLVPACVGLPLLVALCRGELAEMFRYEEESSPEETESQDDESSSEKHQ